MGSKREKYPEKCPWDLGPNQHLAKEENWTLRLGEANVSFSKNKLDNNYFHVISNENEEQILAFRARLLLLFQTEHFGIKPQKYGLHLTKKRGSNM